MSIKSLPVRIREELISKYQNKAYCNRLVATLRSSLNENTKDLSDELRSRIFWIDESRTKKFANIFTENYGWLR